MSLTGKYAWVPRHWMNVHRWSLRKWREAYAWRHR